MIEPEPMDRPQPLIEAIVQAWMREVDRRAVDDLRDTKMAEIAYDVIRAYDDEMRGHQP